MNSILPNTQKRILFYVHDGIGLGHLKRISRIAEALQDPFSCLILSSLRYEANIINDKCEFVYIPSIDSLLERNSKYWGRKPFLDLPKNDAKIFRAKMIDSVVENFNPDAIIVDFLPLGRNDELTNTIMNHSSKKYFIIRGILDDPANIRKFILSGKGEIALEKFYDKIIVTCDKQIINVSKEYKFNEIISNKIVYTGYVSPTISDNERKTARQERNLKRDDIWVVCSTGGGKLGEKLIEECIRLANANPKLKFDIVIGPRSNLKWSKLSVNQFEVANIRFFNETNKIEFLHSAADIVINPGGYNSLIETITGKGIFITVPVQLKTSEEQFIHSNRLSKLIPQIIPLKDIKDLPETFKKVVENLKFYKATARKKLSDDGISAIKKIMNNDLHIYSS